jgi:hypothetical protein
MATTTTTTTPKSSIERWLLASQRNEGVYYEVSDKLAYKGVPLENIDLYFPDGYVPKITFQHQGITYVAIAEIVDTSNNGCNSVSYGDSCGCDLCEQKYPSVLNEKPTTFLQTDYKSDYSFRGMAFKVA